MRDWPSLLNEMIRVTRPGGLIVSWKRPSGGVYMDLPSTYQVAPRFLLMCGMLMT